MKFMLSQSLAQVPVKYVSVQCRGGRGHYCGTIQYNVLSMYNITIEYCDSADAPSPPSIFLVPTYTKTFPSGFIRESCN